MGSTIWSWLSYPFTWWSWAPEEPLPTHFPLVGSSTRGPYDNVEIGNRNVTVWCNDHTCTTMKCDKVGCTNLTCNIYDTDLNGECRLYNTIAKPEEPKPTAPVQTPSVEEKVPETTFQPAATTVTPKEKIEQHPIEERPLELEAVMSSTVPEEKESKHQQDKPVKPESSPQNKVPISS